jgi:CBS-domain-containing membrane protein
MRDYFAKMKGVAASPPCVCYAEIAWSWAGAFLGILAVAWLNRYVFIGADLLLVIGSFGASAVLIYGAIESPLAQPRNLVGGHVLSAVVGVACARLMPGLPWLAAPLAVATAIALMHATKTLHPPGGATALIAVIGGPQVQALGFLYALVPAGLGALIMLAVALVVNNIPKGRRYPVFWF